MRADLLQLAAELAKSETPFVLAIVTSRRPASSAQPGDMALVTADGTFHGWLGGACTRPTVVREAQAALADGKPRLLVLTPDPEAAQRPGVATFPMTCHSGGSVEIYLEPVLPAPRLVVFGVSPAALALARLGQAMGYVLTVVAEDAEGAFFEAPVDVRREIAPADVGESTAARPLYAVVATMGEGDEEAITAALKLRPEYLGVVASARRFGEMRKVLLAGGVEEAALAAIRSPAGLALGARAPEEIALSVLAEIVQLRRAPADREVDTDAGLATARLTKLGTATAPAADSASGAELASTPAADTPAIKSADDTTDLRVHDRPPTATDTAATAIDPMCGMTVNVAKARHYVEYAGQTYYFCCAGCRLRFLVDPEHHVPAESPA